MKSLKKLKPFFIVGLLLSLYIFICTISYVTAVSNDIADSVFRLHVIANSDSVEDQNLKLKVRDKLLLFMNEISKNCSSKIDAMKVANEHIEDFQRIAEQVVRENGYNYTVSIEIGTSNFPTKYYGDIALPCGTYDALKVKIGKANGQNWWCVMFPPLCFVDVSSGVVPDSSKQEMKEDLNDEEYNLINQTDISFKFKLIELFQNWRLGLQ